MRSRTPSYTRASTDPKASRYIFQYDKPDRSTGYTDEEWLSPNQRWKFVVKCDNCDDHLGGGFHSARVVDTSSTRERILFTFWDADIGSGIRLRARWADDSEALSLKGETLGFSYRNRRDEPFAFDLIYLVEDDRMFRVTEDG